MDIKTIITAVCRGVIDSFKGLPAVFYIDKEMNARKSVKSSPSHSSARIRRRASDVKDRTPIKKVEEQEEATVLSRITQCSCLNGGTILFTVFFFEYFILPFSYSIISFSFGEGSYVGNLLWSWIKPIQKFVVDTIYVLPVFLLSKVINCLWFQDIANAAYRYSRGRPQNIESLSKMMADIVFSILVQTLFLVQTTLVGYLPIFYLGHCLYIIHMSLLYSLYAFEYKWINMGWELHRRLAYIETNWPYFIGFGLPLTILTQIPNSYIVSACIFGLSFPIFIISAHEANHVSEVCELPLHLFSPVIKLSNYLFKSTIGSKKTAVVPSKKYGR